MPLGRHFPAGARVVLRVIQLHARLCRALLAVIRRTVIMIAQACVKWAVEILLRVHLLEVRHKPFRGEPSVKVISQSQHGGNRSVQTPGELCHSLSNGFLPRIAGAEVTHGKQMNAASAEVRAGCRCPESAAPCRQETGAEEQSSFERFTPSELSRAIRTHPF